MTCQLNSEQLIVLVSGGGPVGMTFALSLSTMMKTHAKIYVYEGRWYADGDGKMKWQGEEQSRNRRDQVVTLQDHVIHQLPTFIQVGLFANINERVWPTSRNIPIREVEDRLLVLAEPFVESGQIVLVPENLNEKSDRLLNGQFDVLIGSDGVGSFVRNYCKIDLHRAANEYACGVAYNIPIEVSSDEEPLHQALNCILTIGQTRYLVNSSTSRRGYLNVRLTSDEYNELQEHLKRNERNERVNLLNFDKYPNSPVWTIIRQGLDYFKIPHKFVFRVLPIEINVQHATSVVKEFEFPLNNDTKTTKKIPVCLAGDAAMAVHFWPGRGMNSGMKAAMALSRNIARLFIQEDSSRIQIHKPLTYFDFLDYEDFMLRLRQREQHGRSLRITNNPIDESVLVANTFSNLNGSYEYYVGTLKEKLQSIRALLQNRPDWPHRHRLISDEEIQSASNRISANAVAQLSLANPWPTREMAGAEVLLEDYFPLEQKTWLPLPSTVTWIVPDHVQQSVARNKITTTDEPIPFIPIDYIVRPSDPIYAIWCTEIGGESFPVTPGYQIGQFPPDEGPQNIFDLNNQTKYFCYGKYAADHYFDEKAWFRAGFFVTPTRGITCALGFYFGTANDFPERDPMMITIEGSNETNPMIGSNWTLIYNGSSGLEIDPGRNSCGIEQHILNDKWFSTYRILVTKTRDESDGAQYSQFYFFGH
ncbi:unnamed protein product [Adineta steineri]|uniref:Uncharacterized protein n=1 Tax=Adineta steineri TaxID=433720 RepID=A0A814K6L6_9BILA|nr:unnamed protein product [Adineta steineri]CAF3478558.1 unnamed protein product [Adineta steineri]